MPREWNPVQQVRRVAAVEPSRRAEQNDLPPVTRHRDSGRDRVWHTGSLDHKIPTSPQHALDRRPLVSSDRHRRGETCRLRHRDSPFDRVEPQHLHTGQLQQLGGEVPYEPEPDDDSARSEVNGRRLAE